MALLPGSDHEPDRAGTRTLHKRLLGIDYGSVRIGIAVSDPLRLLAHGVTTIANSTDAVSRIAAFSREYDVERIIVGYPLTLKGERGRKAMEVDEFVETLRRHVPCPIELVDERFSSAEAAETVRAMGVPRKARRKKGMIDTMAAAIILQSYLDSHRTTTDELSRRHSAH